MKLEVGKMYKTRGGDIVRLETSGVNGMPEPFQYRLPDGGMVHIFKNGAFQPFSAYDSEFDIVEEVEEVEEAVLPEGVEEIKSYVYRGVVFDRVPSQKEIEEIEEIEEIKHRANVESVINNLVDDYVESPGTLRHFLLSNWHKYFTGIKED